jgi:prevent-host-death family protein
MKLSTDVKPISYLKAHAAEIVRNVRESHGTLVITQRGEATVVVQDVESYEQTQDSIAMLRILALSASSLRNGRVKPLKKALADIRRKIAA